MPFLATPLIIAGVTIGTVGGLLLTVASIGYQIAQANKMKRKMKAAEEARKGFEITRKDAVENLVVIYGENKVGSLITDLKIRSNYNYATPSNYSTSLWEPAQNLDPYYSSNYYIEVSVIGDVGVPLTGDGETGNDIINITSVTYKILWNGVTVYNSTKTMSQNVVEGYNLTSPIVAAKFSSLRDALTSFDVGLYEYYSEDAGHRISDTVYRFAVRRMNTSLLGTTTNTVSFNSNLNSNKTGSKNEYLFTQHAIGFAGVSAVVDFDIDSVRRTEKRYTQTDAGYVVNFYPNGGIADNMSTANGFPSTNTFTNVFYAAACWKLNRDDPQFNGIPAPQFYVRGQKVTKVLKSGDVYTLDTTKTYSNNPTRVLLDYLINSSYGRGLSDTELDLKSFYDAQQLCEETVLTNVTVAGRINGGPSLKNIKRYEFNGFIDTANPVRDNVQTILDSMGHAKLVWSGGKYKLRIGYPTEQPSVLNGLVSERAVFDDSFIKRDKITISYPSAEDKFNQVTVKFANAFKDYKSDSISWPETFSNAHSIYLAEDNYQPLTTELNVYGITNPYHAQARAEELVRTSRSSYNISLTLDRRAMFLEPGDYFILSSELAQLEDEVFRVESIKINDDLTISVEAYLFSYQFLAWNMPNDIAYGDNVIVSAVVPPPSNVLFTSSSGELYGISSGILSWDEPESAIVTKFVVGISNNDGTTWATLGETYTSSFELPALNTGVYKFSVRSKTSLNKLSVPVIAMDSQANEGITIQRATPDKVAVIYADSSNELTNTQSYTLSSQQYVGYYTYSGDLPTLPIRSEISFARFVSEEQILVYITTDTGTVFRNDSGSPKTLTANVAVGNTESSDYSGYTFKWMYNNNTLYMDQNRNVLNYNNLPLTDPTIAATIPGAMLADSTQSSTYNGSLRQLIVGPEDVYLSAKFKVEVGNI